MLNHGSSVTRSCSSGAASRILNRRGEATRASCPGDDWNRSTRGGYSARGARRLGSGPTSNRARAAELFRRRCGCFRSTKGTRGPERGLLAIDLHAAWKYATKLYLQAGGAGFAAPRSSVSETGATTPSYLQEGARRLQDTPVTRLTTDGPACCTAAAVKLEERRPPCGTRPTQSINEAVREALALPPRRKCRRTSPRRVANTSAAGRSRIL